MSVQHIELFNHKNVSQPKSAKHHAPRPTLIVVMTLIFPQEKPSKKLWTTMSGLVEYNKLSRAV